MATEGYKPTAGMQAAARRAIKLKEEGKAKGAGTMVGWTRAGQLARGETLSLSTVKRMYSFFSRHEVDKKGKDFNNAENPSNGKIMWLAWGGDAGFSWSRKIATREKNMKKNLEMQEVVEEIKDMLTEAVSPVDTVVEIPEDDLTKSIDPKPEDEMDNTKGCKCNGCMECKANGGCDMEMCKGHDNMYKSEDLSDEEVSKSYESDNEDEDKWSNMEKACWSGYEQQGMKDKGGRKVPNCVPIKKSADEAPINEAEKEVKKSIWGGAFLK